MDGTPVGRRVFLGLLGAGAAGILWGSKAQRWLEQNVGPYLAKDGTGLSGLLPIGRFRIYSVTGSMPHRGHDEYRLRVSGLVDQPLTLTYAELRTMPATGLTRDFQCVTGWRVFAVQWKGVRLGDVLDRAGVQTGAKALRFRSFDGTYTESLTLKQARRDDVLVAYELEGEELSDAHGGPGAALRRADVRLQVDQVARPDRGDRRGRPRLLGRPRLRRRRMGRALEQPGRQRTVTTP